MKRILARTAAALMCAFGLAASAQADDGARLVRLDHYVKVRSTAPGMAGQDAQIDVREVVLPGTVLRGGPGADQVVLFVHGAGTPAEVSFDVPYKDYSWMGYLAGAGFDVFSMDMTGYGRSSRPAPRWPTSSTASLPPSRPPSCPSSSSYPGPSPRWPTSWPT